MSTKHDIRIELPEDFDTQLRAAVAFFWRTRDAQATAQVEAGDQDRGARGAVTGGKQMDGFASLITQALRLNGVPGGSIYARIAIELPGYFRPTKQWDLLVVHEGTLLAVLELKSQVGPSFGNNFNNRTEEAVGSAVDIWTAYREGVFGDVRRPWLGYLFMLEESAGSTSRVSVKEPHFPVFPEFKGASYATRYEELCRRLVRENLYTEVAFCMSQRGDVDGSSFREPAPELNTRAFIQSLLASVKIGLE